MQRSTYAFLSAAILTTALSGAPAMAQSASQPPAQPQTAPAITQPTDQQLQRFASASQKISSVIDEYRPQINAAKTDDARQKVLQEADAKAMQLVSAEGLTFEEFNGIGRAVQQDPQLKQRVMKIAQGTPK